MERQKKKKPKKISICMYSSTYGRETDFRGWRYFIEAARRGETNKDWHLLLHSCSQIHQPLGQKRRPSGPQN